MSTIVTFVKICGAKKQALAQEQCSFVGAAGFAWGSAAWHEAYCKASSRALDTALPVIDFLYV